jgi:hypothetical protein
MELQKLKKYSKEYNFFKKEINSLQQYLDSRLKRFSGVELFPEKISLALSIDESDLLFIFSLAEQEHLMKRKFLVYSKNQDFLGSFDSDTRIPDELTNLNTGETIDRDNFYIDLVFEPINE